MNEAKLRGYLETATSVAVILVAIVILATFVRNQFDRSPNFTPQAGLQKGEQITNLGPVLNRRSDRQTVLLLAMSTSCHFCEDSVPFYNSLNEALQRNAGSPAVLAVFPDPQERIVAYAKSKDFRFEAIGAVDFKTLKVSATPTLIWLDRSGKILDFWVGKLSKEGEQQVFKTLGLNSG